MNFDTNNAAQLECAKGVAQAVRFQADAMDHINNAIAADANYCLPLVLKAWMLQGANDQRFDQPIAKLTEQAQQLLPSGTSIESELLATLKPMATGHHIEGATQLAALSKQYPTDTFIHLTAQEAIFWLGDGQWMRNVAEQAAPHWKPTDKDYGPSLSLRAFANEEAGFYDDAER